MNVDGCEKRMNEGCKNIIHLFLSGIHSFCIDAVYAGMFMMDVLHPFSKNHPLWMDRLSIGLWMYDIHP